MLIYPKIGLFLNIFRQVGNNMNFIVYLCIRKSVCTKNEIQWVLLMLSRRWKKSFKVTIFYGMEKRHLMTKWKELFGKL